MPLKAIMPVIIIMVAGTEITTISTTAIIITPLVVTTAAGTETYMYPATVTLPEIITIIKTQTHRVLTVRLTHQRAMLPARVMARVMARAHQEARVTDSLRNAGRAIRHQPQGGLVMARQF